ncbi:ATP-binding cassette domain-containing protein [Anoxybacterium hadale]|uniref:ATP-binding cassette domain-containing protein n=1 Tax=Anoxybacterium hadale TaxID=3408580 RepID=UPI003B00A5D9
MIELKNVTFSYSGQGDGGLKNFSLSVRSGECILLCGRSGCGKTTVTRLVNGLIPHFFIGELTGSVMVNGMEVARTPLYRTAEKIGSVFQNPRTQFFNVDTDSEIAFGLKTRHFLRRSCAVG